MSRFHPLFFKPENYPFGLLGHRIQGIFDKPIVARFDLYEGSQQAPVLLFLVFHLTPTTASHHSFILD
jgi:hypothetical protein